MKDITAIDILSRSIAAIFGGYALASLFSIVFAKALLFHFNYPIGESVLVATMLGHLILFVILISSFSPIRLKHIWISLILFLFVLLLLNSLYPMP